MRQEIRTAFCHFYVLKVNQAHTHKQTTALIQVQHVGCRGAPAGKGKAQWRTNTVVTCTHHSAPLKKSYFILSAPIHTPLNIYFSACHTNLQGESALRTAPRDSEVHSTFTLFVQEHWEISMSFALLSHPLSAGFCLHVIPHSSPHCHFPIRAAWTSAFPLPSCCCSSCSAVGALQKLAIPVLTRPTGALEGSFPLTARQKLKTNIEIQSVVIPTPSNVYWF